MTERDRTPEPIRYEPAPTGGFGMFDTAGWPGVPVRADLNNGGGGRRDYGPKGCAGFAVLPALFAAVALMVRRGGRRG